MKILLTALFIFFFFSDTPENLYGTYWFNENDIMLNLSPPDNYTMFVIERNKRTGMTTSKEHSRGTFDVAQDTLRLWEDISNNRMNFLVASEEKLQVIHAKGLESGDIFLCWIGYHPNGSPKFEGRWRKEKKHGTWVYYDEGGNVKKTIEYRRGKVKD